MFGSGTSNWPDSRHSQFSVSSERSTDICLVEGLKFGLPTDGSNYSSPSVSVAFHLHNLPILEVARDGLVRRLPSRRPSPSASRPRTVAVLNDQEG